MRDTHATGIGSIMGAGTAGYCVGNLQLEGMPLPGEDPSFPYPESLASPLQVGAGLLALLYPGLTASHEQRIYCLTCEVLAALLVQAPC